MHDPRPAISDTSDADLQAWLAARGEPAYRLRQIRRHATRTSAAGWSELTDLPAGLRDALAAAFRWSSVEPVLEQASADGETRKVLLQLHDGHRIETVLMPHHRQAIDHDGATTVLAHPEAELHVRHPVEAKLWIEAAGGERIGAPEGHAVALDRVHLWTFALGELLHGPLPAQPVWPGDHDGRVGKDIQQGRDRVAFELDPGIEKHDDLPRRGVEAGVDRGGKAERRIQRHHSQAFGGAVLQPSRDARISRVVDDHGLEVRPGVREDRQEPSLGVGLPTVDDREHRDGSRLGLRLF